MKKSLMIIFSFLIVLIAAGSVFAEGGTIFPWQGGQYTIEATHLIVHPVLPEAFMKPDHLVVMVLMESLNGEISKDLVSEKKKDFIFSIQDQNQVVEYKPYLTITHKVSKGNSSSNEDTVAIFGYVYDLEDRGVEALENAKLLIPTEKKGERISISMDLLEPIENVDVAGALGYEAREVVETEEHSVADEAAEKESKCPMLGIRNVDPASNSFDFFDLNSGEKIEYERLYVRGKQIEAYAVQILKSPTVSMFFDKSKVVYNSDGSFNSTDLWNLTFQTIEDEFCYTLKNGDLNISGRRGLQ